MAKQERKFDKRLYQRNASNFIPMVAHYDDHTLVTKNGELIQIIYVRGLNKETVSSELPNLMSALRKSIDTHAVSHNISFWVQTVRAKIDLEYDVDYECEFSKSLYEKWTQKHYWHDKYANSLYLSIIYRPAGLQISNVNAFVNTFFRSVTEEFHNNHLQNSTKKLTNITDLILSDLNAFHARKLSVAIHDDDNDNEYAYSELLSFYKYVMTFSNMPVLNYSCGLDKVISDFYYALGTNVIEIVSEQHKKFVAALAIREHHHLSAMNLDFLLQVSSELTFTEVFYFTDADICRKKYAYENYILNVSQDSELIKAKGYDVVFNNTEHYCQQQLLITIPADSIDELEAKIRLVSDRLSSLGIVHCREDMMLEHGFWSQLPGNFKFLRRLSDVTSDHIAGFASLHNFPIGKINSIWGDPITILRTKIGTPYFFNFHKEDVGHTCIYGGKQSGKTTVLNFLISQSMKFKPTIMYVAKNNTSQLFIAALNGTWYDSDIVFNPLTLSRSTDNARMLLEFFKIICDHYDNTLTEEQIQILMSLVEYIYSLPEEQKQITHVYHTFDFSDTEGGKKLKQMLSIFVDPKYAKIFDTEHALININDGHVTAINLYKFSDENFKKLHYPDDEKLVPKYEEEFRRNKNIRAAYALTLLEPMLKYKTDRPHMLCVDDFFDIFGHIYFSGIYANLCELIRQNNGLILSTCSIDFIDHYDKHLWSEIFKINATRIIMPMDAYDANIGKNMNLSEKELKEFATLIINNRLLFIKKANEDAVSIELNLGNFPKDLKILSCEDDDLKRYKDAVKEGGETGKWIPKFYEMLDV